MKFSRREFIQRSGMALSSLAIMADVIAGSDTRPKIKAIAFDGLAIFDPSPIYRIVSHLFPEQGAKLIEIWNASQFRYQWLRTCAGMYKNFWELTQDSLEFAAASCNVKLNSAD